MVVAVVEVGRVSHGSSAVEQDLEVKSVGESCGRKRWDAGSSGVGLSDWYCEKSNWLETRGMELSRGTGEK